MESYKVKIREFKLSYLNKNKIPKNKVLTFLKKKKKLERDNDILAHLTVI